MSDVTKIRKLAMSRDAECRNKKKQTYDDAIKRQYFYVCYDMKDVAKALGARWDKEAKCWYSERSSVSKALKTNGFEMLKV